jgi:hypothetical protein
MLTTIIVIVIAAALLALARPASAYEVHRGPTGVITYDAKAAAEGYILLSPTVKCNVTYLINREGDVVHQWNCAYPPACTPCSCPTAGSCAGPPCRTSRSRSAARRAWSRNWTGTATCFGSIGCAPRTRSSTTASTACPTATP